MHENAGNLGFRIPYFRMLVEDLGVSVLAMAYRGYTYSDGSPDEEGLKKDGEAVTKFL